MKKINKLMDDLNKPLSREQLEKIIYNVFSVFIFLSPIISDQIGFGIYSLKYTLFNLITIITTIGLLITSSSFKKLNKYDFILGVYLILVILSTLFTSFGIDKCILGTNGRGEGLITIISYIATFTIFAKGYSYIPKNFKVIIVAIVVICIYSILQANLPFGIDLPFGNTDYFGVAEATMGNQNFLSSYICLFLPMFCYYYLKVDKNTSLILIALLFVTLVYTKTLNAYTVFIIMFILISIYVIVRSKNKEKILIKVLLMILIFVLLFIMVDFINEGIYSQELFGLKNELNNIMNKDEEFGTGRLRIWKRVVMAIGNNHILGVGPDSLKNEFEDKQYHLDGDSDVLNSVIVDKAHCEYLHIGVTTGIPSMIVYILFVIIICAKLTKIVFKINRENIKNNDKLFITMILISIISYLAQAIGNISVVQVAPVFWAMLGIGAGITANESVKDI